ncbi:MAG: prepilin-type N-terminal cleavage/methylation domain-containing protein [Phycisphaeraceae bacterium]
MSIPTRHIDASHRTNRAFSMLEVLFSLMILGVGLLAVASIFPVATVLQRETVDDIYAQQATESVTAMVLGRGFSREQLSDPTTGVDPIPDVQPMPQEVLEEASPGLNDINWLLADRCYPGYQPSFDIAGDESFADNHLDRLYYWVPLVQWKEDDTWRIYVFILRNATKSDYALTDIDLSDDTQFANPTDSIDVPRVRRQGDITSTVNGFEMTFNDVGPHFHPSRDLDLGTQFLDNHGVIHTVVLISGQTVTVAAPIEQQPDEIWYGMRSSDDRISARKVLSFGSEVLR